MFALHFCIHQQLNEVVVTNVLFTARFDDVSRYADEELVGALVELRLEYVL